MSFFNIESSGFDEAMKEIDGLGAKMNAASGQALLAMAQRVREVAIEEITARVRSAPGQPPASRTGRLADSIVARLVGEATAEVAAAADYAKHLEFGTRKMAAHAFLEVAIAIVAPEFGIAEHVLLYLVGDRLKDYASTAIAEAL